MNNIRLVLSVLASFPSKYTFAYAYKKSEHDDTRFPLG